MISPELVGVISFISLLVLIFLGMPVAFAMTVVGFVGFWATGGLEAARNVAAIVPFKSTAQYTFTVVPMFVLMGNLVYHSGFGKDLFNFASRLVGRFPGGLAQSTVLAGALFGAVTGSSLASSTTLAKIAVPEMRKAGYGARLACGSVVAAGPLASMIPPSITMVLYAMVTQQAVGKLLIAGILPGLMTAALLMAQVWLMTWLNPSLAPRMAGASWRSVIASAAGTWHILLIALCVLGSIYTGLATPTEAGALGAFAALLLSIVTRRLNWHVLWASIFDTAKTMGLICAIIVGAFIFSTQFSVTRLPTLVSGWVGGLPIYPLGILLAIMLMYVFLGCFMDTLAMLFLTMPIIFPIAVNLGFDPIWFGILIVQVFEIALITPPYGLALFGVKTVLDDVPMSDIIRGAIPFLLAEFVALALLIAFPGIALFLPSQMK